MRLGRRKLGLHALLEHRGIVGDQRGKEVELESVFLVAVLAYKAVIDDGAVGGVAVRSHAVGVGALNGRGNGGVERVGDLYIALVVLGEVAVQQLQEGGNVLDLAIDAGQGVRGMIVIGMILL